MKNETPILRARETALRALLERDQASDGIISVRECRISRSHYAQLLGCHKSQLTRFHSVFEEYESRFVVASGFFKHMAEMETWLSAAYDSGDLKMRGGKIDRSAFGRRFGLGGNNGGWLASCPPLRDLFERFDAKAEQEGYMPRLLSEDLERLREALAGSLVLNSDRVTINRDELLSRANIPNTRLYMNVFSDLIEVKEKLILADAKTSKIDPYVFGRVFAFSSLVPVWRLSFMERVAVRFKQVLSGYSKDHAKTVHLRGVDLLGWIGSSDRQECRAVLDEAVNKGRVNSHDNWEGAVLAYRDHLIARVAGRESSETSVGNAMMATRVLASALASGGIVPAMSAPVLGIKNSRRRAGHLRSVAETRPRAEGDRADYVEFARARFSDIAKTWAGPGASDHEDFLRSLGEELRSTPDLPAEPAAAIRVILERRLDILRAHAVSVLDSAIAEHKRGIGLLSNADLDVEQLDAILDGEGLNWRERATAMRRWFPDPDDAPDDERERGLANLLTLIVARHNGLPPSHPVKEKTRRESFLKLRSREHGGLSMIARLLLPDADAVGAVITLYLCDSGANLSVARTLHRDCCEVSDLAGHRRITGHKSRARGKPIIVDLPDDSAAVRGLLWIRSATERLRELAGSDRDNLFLTSMNGCVKAASPYWYTSWFKNFVSDIQGLETLGLLPQMVRPSVLLLNALGQDGRLLTGLAIGQHGLNVSQGYQQKWPTRLLYDDNIRRFQTAFETLVLSGIEDAATRLGMTASQFEARLGHLGTTGLGTFCRDQRGRTPEPGKTCATLDCWNDCPHLLIVAEVDAIASLQLWQSSLRGARAEWERDHPERWDSVWLPWLCLTDVVEEKMARGPMIKTWNAARERAREISGSPAFVPPKPW